MNIKIEQTENGFKSFFKSGFELDKSGVGATMEESLTDLVFQMKAKALENEEEKFNLFITERKPIAFELFKGLYSVMGDKWFTLYQLCNKLQDSKEMIIIKLRFLSQFGYLSSDRPEGAGSRFQLVCSVAERKKMFEDRKRDFQKEIELCDTYLESIKDDVDFVPEKVEVKEQSL